MKSSVTVHMTAPAAPIWELISDVRNTPRFSPEVFETEWLDGVTAPAVGARFRGHVRRNEKWVPYWTTCVVTDCEPGREFGFDVLVGGKPTTHWHYELTPSGDGTDVTESYWQHPTIYVTIARILLTAGLRRRRNIRDMRTTLERIRAVVEANRPENG